MAQLIADQAPGRDGVRRYRSPLEPLELHPVRLDRGLAEPAPIVGLVVGEVALERQRMGRDAVEEEAVVAVNHRATGKGASQRAKYGQSHS
jgi:hypothetical protein